MNENKRWVKLGWFWPVGVSTGVGVEYCLPVYNTVLLCMVVILNTLLYV